ncbi:MAG: hypothetical protein Q8N81_01815 [bacterium]|nr:hypothetical protein [bacterium]
MGKDDEIVQNALEEAGVVSSILTRGTKNPSELLGFFDNEVFWSG